MALERGTRLGLYQIESSIGAGGMGEVYRATDTRLECTVAIKVLPAELIRDKRATPRLLPVISLALSLLLAACSGAPSQPTAERGHPVAPLVNGLPLSAVVGTGHGPVPCARQAHTGSPGATCGATPGSNADGPAGLYRDPNRIQRHTCAGSFTGDRRRIGIEPSRCDRWSHRPRVPGQHVSRPGGFLRLP